ncbi:hypothetical protein LCGC14_1728830, partial [marine sediment metagenome]
MGILDFLVPRAAFKAGVALARKKETLPRVGKAIKTSLAQATVTPVEVGVSATFGPEGLRRLKQFKEKLDPDIRRGVETGQFLLTPATRLFTIAGLATTSPLFKRLTRQPDFQNITKQSYKAIVAASPLPSNLKKPLFEGIDNLTPEAITAISQVGGQAAIVAGAKFLTPAILRKVIKLPVSKRIEAAFTDTRVLAKRVIDEKGFRDTLLKFASKAKKEAVLSEVDRILKTRVFDKPEPAGLLEFRPSPTAGFARIPDIPQKLIDKFKLSTQQVTRLQAGDFAGFAPAIVEAIKGLTPIPAEAPKAPLAKPEVAKVPIVEPSPKVIEPFATTKEGLEEQLFFNIHTTPREKIDTAIDKILKGEKIKVYRFSEEDAISPGDRVTPFKEIADEFSFKGKLKVIEADIADLSVEKDFGHLIYKPTQPPIAPVSDLSQTALPTPPTPKQPAPRLTVEETELLPSESIAPTQEELKGVTSKAEKNAIIIKNAQPKQLNFPSPVFDQHVDTYKSISLPTTSEIRSIQGQIARVNGLRLSGKIKPSTANKQIKRLRSKLTRTAKREGIAVRVTSAGKEVLSLRKAGTFVPVEFSEYKKFDDLKAIGGGGTDITRTIQGIDGSLSVKEKIELPGQAGPAEKFILFRTRQMAIEKSKWMNDRQALKEKLLAGIRPGTAQSREVTTALKFPEKATSEASALATEMRKFFNDLIYEQNFMRMLRNQKIIPFRKNYAPETLRDASIWERIVNFNKQPMEITDAAQLPDYVIPDKPFNPRELANNHGIPFEEQELDIHKLADNYMQTAGRDIFNTSIIQNNKAFIQQLRSNGVENSAATLEKWNSEAYAGTRAALDKGFNFPVKVQKSMRAFNRIRNMGVFPFNFSWSIFTQTSSFALTIGRYGAINSAKGLTRWLTNSSLRRETAEKYYSFVIKAQKAGRVTAQDTDNIVGRDISRYN